MQDCSDGFNFAVFSRHAERVELLIFADMATTHPLWTFDLDPVHHRIGDIWHVLVEGAQWGQAYAYRVHGPWAPEAGHRFDGHALLLDPYALAVSVPVDLGDPDPAARPTAGRCLLVNRRFDWQGTTRPRTPWSETVIYETHVRGLTIHPSANCAHPGTFLGVIDKIPYFRELGITAVELMPVQEFYQKSQPSRDPISGRRLRNYWGYDTIAFFAPARTYATAGIAQRRGRRVQGDGARTAPRRHRGHSRHGLQPHRRRQRAWAAVQLSGSGQRDLLHAGRRRARLQELLRLRQHGELQPSDGARLIIDCLRYWVTEMHVDGFRFDLASILGRDEEGNLVANPPLLERIAEDPILRDVKLIAEAWDAGGAYQVGSFPGQRWAEWNGRFRDDVRRFWRGDAGMIGALASRLCGSADLYQRSGKQPVNSINFVTCHDGFTLNDAVSYATKHNEANGNDNRDGADENYSANYGVEGPTQDAAIDATRLRQIKNMLATLLLSRGVPMLLGGDEFRRTQGGNNNAYCQDNEVSWYDWRLIEQNREILRFARELIAFRSVIRSCAPMRFTPAKSLNGLAPMAARRTGTGRHARSDAWCGSRDRPAHSACCSTPARRRSSFACLPHQRPGGTSRSIPPIRHLATYFRLGMSGRCTTAADIGSSPALLRFSRRAELRAETVPATDLMPERVPSVAEEWLPARRCALSRLSRRTHFALATSR